MDGGHSFLTARKEAQMHCTRWEGIGKEKILLFLSVERTSRRAHNRRRTDKCQKHLRISIARPQPGAIRRSLPFSAPKADAERPDIRVLLVMALAPMKTLYPNM